MSKENIEMMEQMIIVADNTLTQAENNLLIVLGLTIAIFVVSYLIRKFF